MYQKHISKQGLLGPGLLSTYLSNFSGLFCHKDGERLALTNHNKVLGITDYIANIIQTAKLI
jgi:hypothetical protein